MVQSGLLSEYSQRRSTELGSGNIQDGQNTLAPSSDPLRTMRIPDPSCILESNHLRKYLGR